MGQSGKLQLSVVYAFTSTGRAAETMDAGIRYKRFNWFSKRDRLRISFTVKWVFGIVLGRGLAG